MDRSVSNDPMARTSTTSRAGSRHRHAFQTDDEHDYGLHRMSSRSSSVSARDSSPERERPRRRHHSHRRRSSSRSPSRRRPRDDSAMASPKKPWFKDPAVWATAVSLASVAAVGMSAKATKDSSIATHRVANASRMVASASHRSAGATARVAHASNRVADASHRSAGATARVAHASNRVADASHRSAGATARVANASHRVADASHRAASAAEHQQAKSSSDRGLEYSMGHYPRRSNNRSLRDYDGFPVRSQTSPYDSSQALLEYRPLAKVS